MKFLNFLRKLCLLQIYVNFDFINLCQIQVPRIFSHPFFETVIFWWISKITYNLWLAWKTPNILPCHGLYYWGITIFRWKLYDRQWEILSLIIYTCFKFTIINLNTYAMLYHQNFLNSMSNSKDVRDGLCPEGFFSAHRFFSGGSVFSGRLLSTPSCTSH